MLKHLFWSLAIPLLLIALALELIPWSESLPAAFAEIRHYVPYLTLAVTMVLSLSFNQTRLFFLLLTTGIYLVLLFDDAPIPDALTLASSTSLSHLIALFYPVTLVLLLFSRERGIFTLNGGLRFVVLCTLPFFVLFLAQKNGALPMTWLEKDFLPAVVGNRTTLPDPVLVIYGLVLISVLLRLLLRPGMVESGFLALLLGSGFGLHYFPSPARMEVLFTAGILAVLVVLIRNSFHLAYRDELTGLPARRALREQLLKLGRRYSIAMVDVDHFKKFNDCYGHDIGDQVLKMVAKHLARTGGGGRGFRYGGEEFTLLYPGKLANDVTIHLEQLRESIADARFVVRSKHRPKRKPGKGRKLTRAKGDTGTKQVKITISIGLADNSGVQKLPDEVLKAADKALYRAKEKGRNRLSR